MRADGPRPMQGKLILTSLERPPPRGCDLYIAAVQTMPCAVPGWRWSEQIADLGPPPDLHARAQVWKGGAQWTSGKHSLLAAI
jgi:hypothetical protein